MSVCLRYSSCKEEAEEILNEGFIKVFKKIDLYDENYEFKKWFRRILINTSVDYFRKYKKMTIHHADEFFFPEGDRNIGWDNLLYEDVVKQVQLLPPAYRLVVNLYAIDGYKHHEIAEQLNISVGTSKSNYSKARRLLQTYLKKNNSIKKSNYGE